jgi:hypothetical protein
MFARQGASTCMRWTAHPLLNRLERLSRNRFAEKITLIRERWRKLIFVKHADIIISEWWGTFVHESMLDTVLYARGQVVDPS